MGQITISKVMTHGEYINVCIIIISSELQCEYRNTSFVEYGV